MTGRPRAVDSLVNSSFLGAGDDRSLNYLFRDLADRPPVRTPEDLLAQMDACDVGAAVVSIMNPTHAEWVGEAHRRYPKKILPAMITDPTKGFSEIQRVVEYHEKYNVRCLRMPPFRYGLPPTDRAYWPFYVKALELGIAVGMNAGMPGPRRPGWVQNPMYFDEVAFHFPDLRLVMSHCGQPWIDETISVIAHWDNVYMACTSVAPRYWEPKFVQFINTRGREKMMYGTEYVIPWDRSRDDLDGLDLRDAVQPLFYVENARRAYGWDFDVS